MTFQTPDLDAPATQTAPQALYVARDAATGLVLGVYATPAEAALAASLGGILDTALALGYLEAA